jgi:hypothetical protein
VKINWLTWNISTVRLLRTELRFIMQQSTLVQALCALALCDSNLGLIEYYVEFSQVIQAEVWTARYSEHHHDHSFRTSPYLRYCLPSSFVAPQPNRLVDLVVRVSGYRSRDPGVDSRRYQILWEVVGLERGTFSLVSTIEELLGRNGSRSALENRDYGRNGFAALTTRHPSSHKSWH